MTEFVFNQIGTIRSPYKEKFAVPRQPGLVEDGGGELVLLPPYNQAEAVRGLSEFSHLWVMFIFHQTMEGGWRPTVRPPRLGGNARMGVFATRSTFRPNPLGMSLIELKNVRTQGSDVVLELGSLDLVDGTPVVDIKPYLPFAESQPQARAGFAQQRQPVICPCFLPLKRNSSYSNIKHATRSYGALSLRFWLKIHVQPTVRGKNGTGLCGLVTGFQRTLAGRGSNKPRCCLSTCVKNPSSLF